MGESTGPRRKNKQQASALPKKRWAMAARQATSKSGALALERLPDLRVEKRRRGWGCGASRARTDLYRCHT
jgi:hypothetical protein